VCWGDLAARRRYRSFCEWCIDKYDSLLYEDPEWILARDNVLSDTEYGRFYTLDMSGSSRKINKPDKKKIEITQIDFQQERMTTDVGKNDVLALSGKFANVNPAHLHRVNARREKRDFHPGRDLLDRNKNEFKPLPDYLLDLDERVQRLESQMASRRTSLEFHKQSRFCPSCGEVVCQCDFLSESLLLREGLTPYKDAVRNVVDREIDRRITSLFFLS